MCLSSKPAFHYPILNSEVVHGSIKFLLELTVIGPVLL